MGLILICLLLTFLFARPVFWLILFTMWISALYGIAKAYKEQGYNANHIIILAVIYLLAVIIHVYAFLFVLSSTIVSFIIYRIIRLLDKQ